MARRVAIGVALLGFAGAAQGTGGGLAVLLIPTMVDVCVQAQPALSPRLRASYATWSASLSPEERSMNEAMGNLEEARKLKDAARAEFQRMSTHELAERCEDLVDVLSGGPKAIAGLESPEAAWRTFVNAMRAGDRRMALRVLSGEAKERFRQTILTAEASRLAAITGDIEQFALDKKYGDMQDFVVVRKDKRAGIGTLMKSGPNWHIIQVP